MTFGKRIQTIRLKLGETQLEFSKRFGVTTPAVSLWETDQRQAPYKVLYFIEKVEICNKCNGKGFIIKLEKEFGKTNE